jgi:hypothetical protein
VQRVTDVVADFIGGFVAAEGCFTRSGNRFRFAVGLGASDTGMCELMHEMFGVGHLVRSSRRKAHYDDEVQFYVASTPELVNTVVPFMDVHLPDSHKREQYTKWRAATLEYWEHAFRRRKRCSVDGCEVPAKAYGLCRRHLWAIRRQ